MKYYACFDIGGTVIKVGIIDNDANFIKKTSMPTEASKGPDIWFMNIVHAVEEMKKDYEISGVCISSSGMINANDGKVFFALDQIPGYTGFDIKSFIEKHCNLPCEVENDVNCVVLAETISGSGKGYSSVLGLAIGTGVGGGITINGKLINGASFSTGEVGYVPVGNSNLEHTASTTALINRVKSFKNDCSDFWNGKSVFEAAAKGDLDCIKAIDENAKALACGLSTLSYVVNPHVFVLGGGIMNEKSLFDKVCHYYREYTNPLVADLTDIKQAMHHNDAGMLGAFYNFKQKRSS